MIPQETIFQALPYIASLASGALLTSAVALRMMRSSTRAMFAGRPALEPRRATAIALPEPEHDDAPPPAIAGIAARRSSKRLLRAEVAAREFIAFMREHNHVGWYGSDHIDDAWEWFCRQTNTIEIDPSDIRAQLAAIKACRHGYKRLKGPEFEAVRRDLQRDRATVYYIPPPGIAIPEFEAADRRSPADGQSSTGYAPSRGGARPGAGRPPNGARAANSKSGGKSKVSAGGTASPASRHGFDFVPGAELAAA
ncbi:MAG: hypothetical protein B7Y80_01700 [Hyphomicrobium sp. 32-62-53]|nr:MAG: hypothetical protein B7Z29_02050 [Hyphomicrobium sp. 12-62-95]OYY01469.1 MAG: hypothetical protein B7Y80_01700 [Hyphomicrobium sp. 32-62-53]